MIRNTKNYQSRRERSVVTRRQLGQCRRAVDWVGRWGWPLMFTLLFAHWITSRTNVYEPNDVSMPAKVTDDAERELYLTPAGMYTAADIEANERQTASQKYVTFRAQHDFNPQPGDAICPITRTKANSQCTWIIDGEQYAFCCPPCIDEFLLLAKHSPESILAPDDYQKQ